MMYVKRYGVEFGLFAVAEKVGGEMISVADVLSAVFGGDAEFVSGGLSGFFCKFGGRVFRVFFYGARGTMARVDLLPKCA